MEFKIIYPEYDIEVSDKVLNHEPDSGMHVSTSNSRLTREELAFEIATKTAFLEKLFKRETQHEDHLPPHLA